MPKIGYLAINAKAAAITGGFLGFLFWLLITLVYGSSSLYGMVGDIVGYETG